MVKAALQGIPVFDHLTMDQIEEVSTWLQRREYTLGDPIINEGDPPDGLYVLARGDAQVVKSTAAGPLVVAELEAPSVFGELGLLNAEEARSAGVRAKSNVIAGFLPRDLFAEKLDRDNLVALRIGVNLGRIASQRVRATTKRLAELSEDVSQHALHAVAYGITGRK
ncbi:MAG: cyclic nucleotide-binding domain-containing protein [Planctomycetota bacterium]|nr:cyclic nucleotide-binding domain-containing protein [Planctomycetota bacterium]